MYGKSCENNNNNKNLERNDDPVYMGVYRMFWDWDDSLRRSKFKFWLNLRLNDKNQHFNNARDGFLVIQ
jgi:hypothetical protein